MHSADEETAVVAVGNEIRQTRSFNQRRIHFQLQLLQASRRCILQLERQEVLALQPTNVRTLLSSSFTMSLSSNKLHRNLKAIVRSLLCIGETMQPSYRICFCPGSSGEKSKEHCVVRGVTVKKPAGT